MEIYSSLVTFFQAGGLFMYPIVVVLALGVAIALERYVYLTAARATNQRIWKQVMPLLMNGNYTQAVAVTEKSKAALSRILRYGLDRADHARRRDDVEDYSGAYQVFVRPDGENARVYIKYADGTDCEPDAAEHLLVVIQSRLG